MAGEYGVLLGSAFATVAFMTRRPHWELSGSERTDLGEAVAGVMPSIPASMAKQMTSFAPWLRLATVAGMIVAPRIAADAVINEKAVATDPGLRAVPDPPRTRPQVNADFVVPAPSNGARNGTSYERPPGPASIEIPGFTS